MGHLYPGMLDVSTDLTLVPGAARRPRRGAGVRRPAGTGREGHRRRGRRADVAWPREVFERRRLGRRRRLRWARPVSVGLDRLVDDFALDSLAYYHRGLDGEIARTARRRHDPRRVAAHRPRRPGRRRVRAAHLAGHAHLDRLGAGGSFTEFQALNFRDGVVEMGHDGPAHLAISHGPAAAARPRRLPRQARLGRVGRVRRQARPGHRCSASGRSATAAFGFVVSEGEVVAGPLLQIGNTTSRVDFGCDPGEWTDAWSASGVGHHWALGTGHRAADLSAIGDLMGIETVVVDLRP